MTRPSSISSLLDKTKKVNSGCWEWQGYTDKDGYGRFGYNNKMVRAHRFSYEYYKGNLDPTLTIDHLCKNRSCVNPDHLEQVTMKENLLRGEGFGAINSRKTFCKSGHKLYGNNLYVKPNGQRQCRTCAKIYEKKHRQKLGSVKN